MTTNRFNTPIIWPTQLIDRAVVWVVIVALAGGYAWAWSVWA